MKINTKKIALIIILLAIIFSLNIIFLGKKETNVLKTENEKIEEYYANEVATKVSPHFLRKSMAKGTTNNFILVDVRSEEEYIDEHIIGAINIPAYIDKENSAQTDSQRIVSQFKKLKNDYPKKDIIIYCYSYACMTGKKIGNLLANNKIFVKELNIGWNEWRYFWQQWNYPHEWEELEKIKNSYIFSGKEPGKFKPNPNTITGCSLEGDLGC